MKILNKESNTIIEVKDKNRIEKLLGYPDKFEAIKKVIEDKTDKQDGEKQDEKSSKFIEDKTEE